MEKGNQYYKRICISTILVFSISSSYSQNLVPNPSFEDYTECPYTIQDGWLECTPWQNGNCATSDYYHVCATSPDVSVPDNWVGHQETHTGDAYMGFICKWDAQPWQEYPQVQLSEPCEGGYQYEVNFYVSLADFYCGIESIGAYFSINPPDGSFCGEMNVVPQIETDMGFLSDQENWILISGCFIAQGGEQWLTIGNFQSPYFTLTDPNCTVSTQSYYFLDDVSVIQGDPADVLDLELGGPVTTCEPYEIDPEVTGVEFLWSDGSTEPTLTVNVSGTYSLTITMGCSAMGVDSVEVFFEGVPAGVDLGPPEANICEGDSYVISLDPDIGDYEWQDGSTDAEYTITSTGLYQVSFDDGCDITTDEIYVAVMQIFFPEISDVPGSLCEDDDPISLSIIQEGISGTWSGQGVSNNSFDPSGLNGMVELTFTPDPGQCAGAVTTDIIVVQLIPIDIAGVPESLCQYDAPVTLPDIQSGIPGIWSGEGVSNNTFNPLGLDGNILLTFTPDAGICAYPVTIGILVYETTYTISGIPPFVCVTDPPVPLPVDHDGISGNWSGPGVSNNTFNPEGLGGTITLTFTPSGGQCAAPVFQDLLVTEEDIPLIIGVPISICESDFPISLPPFEDGYEGSWSGPGVNSNTFDPNGLNGIIILTFTPTPGQCAISNTVDIEVIPVITPLISGVPASLCENNLPISLPTIQNGINGYWTGQGVSGNNFNPEGLFGIVTITFTPISNQCAEPAQWDIEIEAPIVPIISGLPSEMCGTDLPFNLPVVQNGFSGVWSGPGVSNNVFNPAGQNGIVILMFTPLDGQCATPAQAEVDIEDVILPIITGIPGNLCETDDPVILPVIQDGITGSWFGPGVTNNTFNPNGQNGNVILTFFPENGQCATSATISINIINVLIPVITGVPPSICQSDVPVYLPELQGGITGNWSGPNVTANSFTPTGLNGNYTLTFSPSSGQCAQIASAQITVHSPPAFINLIPSCDTLSETYTVTFEITGGDPASYLVNGSPVNGNIYMSSPFSADSNQYEFTLDDANGCGPAYVQGYFNCACTTNAGTMNFSGTPLQICAGSDFAVSFNGDANLDPDDLFGFVLHDNAGTQLGTVYAMSPDTNFAFPPGIILGQIYYVSPLAGSDNGSGSIDFNDPCLSVAQGIPVMFYQPQVAISNGDVICQNECITYTLELSGDKPFEFNYRINANGIWTDHLLITDTSSVSLVICPQDFSLTSGTLDIIPMTLADARCTVTLSAIPGTQSSILPSSESIIAEVLCPGTSILVNGTSYDQSNPAGTQVVLNAAGCDSTIHINLSFYPTAIFELNQTLCFGGSLMVNGTLYNESNPLGTEILPGASVNGCDSLIQVQMDFDTVITADFSTTLCSGESITINGHVYNESNPGGTELFPNGSALGCDSILNIELFFNPQASSNMDLILCNDEMIIVNGKVYDISHPSGIEVMPGASHLGCDSSVYINLGFYPEAVGDITDTLNIGDSLIIQGTVYHQHHPAGTEIIPGGSITGCDSIIIVTLYFRPSMMVSIETMAPKCYGEASGGIVLEDIIGGLPPYSISIDGGNQITVSGLPVVLSGLFSGMHQLIITDATSTELLFDLDIPEAPLLWVNAGDDQIIPQGEDGQLEANASFQPVTWLWEPGDFLSCVDCPDPRIENADHDVIYRVIVTDQDGCRASDEIVLTIRQEEEKEVYVPNVFSPNGDDINDTWRINSTDENAKLVTLQIFDRWGTILFGCSDKHLNDPSTEWNGSTRGKELGTGVYTFIAMVEKSDGKIVRLRGDITLLR